MNLNQVDWGALESFGGGLLPIAENPGYGVFCYGQLIDSLDHQRRVGNGLRAHFFVCVKCNVRQKN